MNKKVIARKNLPPKFPLLSTLIAYLLLDKFDASGWIWGVIGTIYAIMWICVIITMIIEEEVDLLNGKDK